MWADNETTNDLIGFRVHSDLIRDVVTDLKLLPISIGVFGEWGGGKTSIMRMLERDLNPLNYPEGAPERERYGKIACVYFNGWLFEGYDDAKAAIITSILLKIQSYEGFRQKAGNSIQKLLASVNWMRVISFGVKHLALPAVAAAVTGGTGLLPALLGAGRAFLVEKAPKTEGQEGEGSTELEDFFKDADKDDPVGRVRRFRDDFAQLLTEAGIESLIVLVDDLDRCSPERIIENLEAIKLFVNVERTAFVIGADPRIVKHAIAIRYGKQGLDTDEERQQLVKDYLEKLIQVPYHLPKLSPSEVETYMTLLFSYRYLPDDKFRLCLTACDEKRVANRYSTFRFADVQLAVGEENVNPQLSSSLAFCSLAAPLITDGLKGNPRQVKRFLNAFVLRKQLAQVAKLENIKDDVLVKLMILEYVRPEKFVQLYGWQSTQDGKPEQLSFLEAKGTDVEVRNAKMDEEVKGWEDKLLLRWLHMQPLLAGVDLRNYFWIARDRLDSTLSGTTLIPPVVQKALTGILSTVRAEVAESLELVKTLSPEDVGILLSTLEAEFRRKPATVQGGFIALLNGRVEGVAECLAKAIGSVSATAIEPGFVIRLETALEQFPQAKPVLEPALQHLKKTGTKAARAVGDNKQR
jgi:hypothetical protein